jgi:hypothetical protein
MKNLISILMLLFIQTICGQTPEQQKMIEKAERMRDSIMNTPQMKAVMQQAEDMEKAQQSNTTVKKENNPIPKAKIKQDKYWINTLSSNNNTKLTNWNFGLADLVFNYSYDVRNDKIKYIKVGSIQSDGTIELNPINKVPILESLSEFDNKFYDIFNPSSYQFTKGTTGFKLNSYLLVFQNDVQIGILTVGNSAKVTLNLLTPGDLYYGDEGYMLSWAYADGDCALKVNENFKGDLSNTGTPLIVETNVTYDLNFKPGWNLVKTEVIGTYEFPNAPEEDRSRYKKHKHTIVASIPQGATYFFRKSSQY